MALLKSDNQVDILLRSSADTKGVDDTNKSLSRFDNSAGFSAKSAAMMGSAAAAAESAIRLMGNAIGAAARATIGGAASYEQSSIAFTTMLGDAEKAKGLMSEIAQFAKTTPFELPEVVSGTKQLLAFGFAQQDLLPTMRKLGDLASGLGVPVGQLTNVFGQVRVAGRLMGQDLLQFTNAGVPMIEALAKTMGKPQEEIKKLVEQGKVGFPDVEKALNSLTGEGSKFGGMMDKQSKSFNGIVSNIKDGFGQVARSAVGVMQDGTIVEGGIFDMMKKAAESTLPLVTKLAEGVGPAVQSGIKKLREFIPAVKDVAGAIADYLSPKFGALFKTIQEDVLPVLSKLWKEVIEPLIPVIGTLFVGAIGLVVDGLNLLMTVLAPIASFLIEHKEIVLGVAAAVGVWYAAMKVSEGFDVLYNGTKMAITQISGVAAQADSARGAFSLLNNSLSSAAGFGIIGGAAVAAGIVIVKAGNDAKKAWDDAAAAIRGASESDSAAYGRLQDMIKNGTPEQKARAKATMQKLAETDSQNMNISWKNYIPGFASGGYTGNGSTSDIAGVVHKGEYVIPKDQVNQSTGLPKQGAGGGVVINQTNYNYSQVDMEAANRDLGLRLTYA